MYQVTRTLDIVFFKTFYTPDNDYCPCAKMHVTRGPANTVPAAFRLATLIQVDSNLPNSKTLQSFFEYLIIGVDVMVNIQEVVRMLL